MCDFGRVVCVQEILSKPGETSFLNSLNLNLNPRTSLDSIGICPRCNYCWWTWGSINAWRADGSEYSGEHCQGVTKEEYQSKHRPRIQALVDGGIKFLCFETLPCSAEALALIGLLKEYPNVKAWISFFGRVSAFFSTNTEILVLAFY